MELQKLGVSTRPVTENICKDENTPSFSELLVQKLLNTSFRESLDVRDEESCYFPNLPSPNVTTTTSPDPYGNGRILEPEFRDSIEFLGFGEGDLYKARTKG